jgi:hypothetical protein
MTVRELGLSLAVKRLSYSQLCYSFLETHPLLLMVMDFTGNARSKLKLMNISKSMDTLEYDCCKAVKVFGSAWRVTGPVVLFLKLWYLLKTHEMNDRLKQETFLFVSILA